MVCLKRAQQALIGINYMTLGKDMAPFHAIAILKQTAQQKNSMSQI